MIETSQKRVLVFLIVIFGSSVAAGIYNYYTGVFGKDLPWLPIDPEGDFDDDSEKNRVDPNPFQIDADGDKLLDGHNIVISEDDERFQRFLDAGILYRKNSDGSYIFFGEKSLNSDPLKASPRAVYQAKFLSELEDIEYKKAVKSRLINDFDWDDDFLDNWFEVHKTKTDYLTPNDRYVIWLSTTDPSVFTPENRYWALLIGKTPKEEVYNFLVDWQRIPPENLILLEYRNATIKNLEDAIEYIKAKVDKNDFVYICLESHGNKNGIVLYDNLNSERLKLLSYKKLDELADRITNAKVVVITIGACGSSYAREPLKDGPVPRVVVPMFGLNRLIRRYIPEWRRIEEEQPGKGVNSVPAEDDDGFVSIGEAARDQKIKYKGSSNYDIVDTHGLAYKIFFGDYIIGEKDYRRYKDRE